MDGDRASSTIGIENVAGDDGVQYVFDGAYDITSSPIAGGGISLLFTTNPFGLGAPVVDLEAPVVDIVYTQAGNQITLDWADVSGADNYKVYSANDGYGPWTLLSTVTSSTYSTTLVPGDRYYQVTAQSLTAPASVTATRPLITPVSHGVVSRTYNK